MSDYPVIPELPEPPLRTDGRVDFARKGSVFLGAFPAMRSAFNTAGAWVESAMGTILGYKQDAEQAVQDAQSKVEDAQSKVEDAAIQVGIALGHANAASGFADDASGYANTASGFADDAQGYASAADSYAQVAAATANFKGEWSELSGSLSIPASVFHSGTYWQLLRNIPTVEASEPGVTSDWIGTETEIETWVSVSTNTTLAPSGRYRLDFPGSPITLTLPGSAPNNTLIRLYVGSGSPIGSQINSALPIMGQPAPLLFDANFTGLDLISTGSQWRIK